MDGLVISGLDIPGRRALASFGGFLGLGGLFHFLLGLFLLLIHITGVPHTSFIYFYFPTKTIIFIFSTDTKSCLTTGIQPRTMYTASNKAYYRLIRGCIVRLVRECMHGSRLRRLKKDTHTYAIPVVGDCSCAMPNSLRNNMHVY